MQLWSQSFVFSDINTDPNFVDSNSQQRVELLPISETTGVFPKAPRSHLDSSSSSSLGDPHHKPIPTHTQRLRRGLDWVVTGFFAVKEATILISAHDIIAILDDNTNDSFVAAASCAEDTPSSLLDRYPETSIEALNRPPTSAHREHHKDTSSTFNPPPTTADHNPRCPPPPPRAPTRPRTAPATANTTKATKTDPTRPSRSARCCASARASPRPFTRSSS